MKGGRREGAGTVAEPWTLDKIRKRAYRLHGTACVYSKAVGGPGKALEVDCQHWLPIGPDWELLVQPSHGCRTLLLANIDDPATRRRFEREIADLRLSIQIASQAR